MPASTPLAVLQHHLQEFAKPVRCIALCCKAQVVPVGVDRAISEIITPVVERSVTIACMTTNELILKDFAFEPDDVRLLNVRDRPHSPPPMNVLARPLQW